MRAVPTITLLAQLYVAVACKTAHNQSANLSSEDLVAQKGSLISHVAPTRGNITGDVSYELSAGFLRIFPKNGSADFIRFDLAHAFLGTRASISQVIYEEAMLKMNESILKICRDQTLDQVAASGGTLKIIGSLSSGSACKTSYNMQISVLSPQQIKVAVQFGDAAFTRTTLHYVSSKDEGFFGMGEQYTYFNLKGMKVPVKVEEQGVGRGGPFKPADLKLATGTPFSSNAPMPLYITTQNRAMLVQSSAYSLFDFSQDNEVFLDVWQAPLTLSLWRAPSPLELISLMTKQTGRYATLPAWAHGTILGLQGGRTKVEKVIADAKKAGNPVTGLWIQDWEGRRVTPFGSRLWWRWTADEQAYPNFKEFCASLNAQGIKVLGYINPFLADVGPMFEEAKAGGYLVKNANGEDYRLESVGTPMYLLDLTNPATVTWIKGVIKTNMIGMGLSGWMADFGEYLPFDAKLHSGVPAEIYHNQYPVDWARVNREAIREAGKEDDIVFFTRAGFTGSNGVSRLFWEGDQLVNFDEFDGEASAVTALLSGGISGIALSHSDLGGYTTLAGAKRTRELLYRWAELSAFTAFFRDHEGNRPDDNFQFYTDAQSQTFFARIGRMHYALRDYFTFLEKQAAEQGFPLVRSLYLHYPNDPATFNLRHQFLLGADLLVLPVLTEDAVTVSGYFPKGRWQNVWSKEIIEGPLTKTVDAPLGKPAAFVNMDGAWSGRILSALDVLK